MMTWIEKTWNEMDRRIEEVLLSRGVGWSSQEVSPIQGDAHLEPLRDFVHLAAQAVAIRDCDVAWAVKFEILRDVISPAILKTRVMTDDWPGKGYYQGPEVLVNSRVEALEKRAADIRMILDAIDSLPYGGAE